MYHYIKNYFKYKKWAHEQSYKPRTTRRCWVIEIGPGRAGAPVGWFQYWQHKRIGKCIFIQYLLW